MIVVVKCGGNKIESVKGRVVEFVVGWWKGECWWMFEGIVGKYDC